MTRARWRIAAVLVALATAAAGCAGTKKSVPMADPDVYPTNYRSQIASFLSTVLLDRADFANAQIGTPVLKPVGADQHYVVCVLFAGRTEHREKAVLYLGANINQVVDAQPGQCADTAYQPFTELAALVPHK